MHKNIPTSLVLYLWKQIIEINALLYIYHYLARFISIWNTVSLISTTWNYWSQITILWFSPVEKHIYHVLFNLNTTYDYFIWKKFRIESFLLMNLSLIDFFQYWSHTASGTTDDFKINLVFFFFLRNLLFYIIYILKLELKSIVFVFKIKEYKSY